MLKDKYVLSFDVGTSSIKALLLDNSGKIISHTMKTYTSYMPQPGWMEQDPADYWQAVVRSTRQILKDSAIDSRHICGLVFTIQAMGIIPFDNEGNVLRRNITWVDGRAEEEALWLMNRLLGRKVFK